MPDRFTKKKADTPGFSHQAGYGAYNILKKMYF